MKSLKKHSIWLGDKQRGRNASLSIST